jgi:hypothetical protein
MLEFSGMIPITEPASNISVAAGTGGVLATKTALECDHAPWALMGAFLPALHGADEFSGQAAVGPLRDIVIALTRGALQRTRFNVATLGSIASNLVACRFVTIQKHVSLPGLNRLSKKITTAVAGLLVCDINFRTAHIS